MSIPPPEADPFVKAWVNFDATGNIISNYGVDSVTKNSTGDYTIEFLNNFYDNTYSCVMSPNNDEENLISGTVTEKTVSSVRVLFRGGATTLLGIVLPLITPIDPSDGANVQICGVQ